MTVHELIKELIQIPDQGAEIAALTTETIYEDGRILTRHFIAAGGKSIMYRAYWEFGDTTEEIPEDQKGGEWIPCRERLPEEGEEVLVWYEYFRYGSYNDMYQTYGIGYFYNNNWGGDVRGKNAKCIAWMPLPLAYKEGGAE